MRSNIVSKIYALRDEKGSNYRGNNVNNSKFFFIWNLLQSVSCGSYELQLDSDYSLKNIKKLSS